MDTPYHQLASLLMDIECSLRNLQLWSNQPPAPSALASTQPFACDTLQFTQWLQFIFLPRLYQLIELQAKLPAVCAVAPMAEEYFRVNKIGADALVAQLRQVDELITASE